MSRVVLVPGVWGFLPRYASLTDPFAEVRAAAQSAVATLSEDVTILASDAEREVGEVLLDQTPRQGTERTWLVVGNGSGVHSAEFAPGYLDDRGPAFDAAMYRWLQGSDVEPDFDLGRELFASVDGPIAMRQQFGPLAPGTLDWEGAPFGVQYWVMRWN